MPNPYDDLLGNIQDDEQPTRPKFEPTNLEDDRFQMDGKESLDEILETIQLFNQKAESFSRLLTQMRAIEHKDNLGVLSFFLESDDKNDQGDLAGERKYRDLLQTKFEKIIEPMQDLAKLHIETVKQFNRDIDKNYYSIDKTASTIKSEKSAAVDGIELQRKILSDAANNLEILEKGLEGTTRRMKKYINIGGVNNISIAEYELIVQKQKTLTSGQNHHFDYAFFKINLLDKTANTLGIYMKETSVQYLEKLSKAFEMR